MFNSIIGESLTITSVSICIIVAILLGLVIAYVHMKTTKYSRNFILTLAVMPLLISVIIMMVNGNLGTSVAVLGAFSLVRFRSIPGTSKEILSILWAMGVALAIGMGQIYFAILITLVVSIITLIFYKTKFAKEDDSTQILKVIVPEDLDYEGVMNETLNKYSKEYKLTNVETTNMGSLFELKYEVLLKENVKSQEFINELRTRNGNLKISLKDPYINETL